MSTQPIDRSMELAHATSVDERDLVLAFQRGDEGAYQAIYDRYRDRVQRLCQRMLGNREDAQEAAQEAMFRTYQALIRFNGSYHLGAWITRIATNVCLDQLRARTRRPLDAGVELSELDLREPDEGRHPEVAFFRALEGRRVRRLLETLPPLHRAAIVLRDLEGLSYAEVAAALDLSEGQVKALLHRARQRFKRSWISGVAGVLIPARWLQKVRFAELADKSPAVQSLAPASQAAASCSSVVQQCGQYVTDHVAPVVAAALVSTAVVSGAAGTAPTVLAGPAAAPSTTEETAGSVGDGGKDPLIRALEAHLPKDRDETGAPRASSATTTEVDETDAAPEPVESPTGEPTPEVTPTPDATATPEPEASPTAEPDPSPSASESPTGETDGGEAAYQPKSLILSYGSDDDPGPTYHWARVDCDTPSVEQKLATTLSDGYESYPASLVLETAGEVASLSLTVSYDGEDIGYSASGAIAEYRDGSHMELSYRGRFKADTGRAREVGLAEAGDFDLDLTLDCKAGAVAGERLFLEPDAVTSVGE